MTIDEFIEQLTDISSAVQRRLSRTSLDPQYQDIPVPVLQQLYVKYRSINFNVPDSPFELVAVTFGFVELDVIHRMKELYFASLADPTTWPATVDRFKDDAARLEAAVVEDMERAFTRSR